MTRVSRVFLLIAFAATACTADSQSTRDRPGAGSSGSSGESGRTLVAAVRVEPYSVATRAPEEGGVALYLTKGMFNAELAVLDTHESAVPDLAESLPRLHTES